VRQVKGAYIGPATLHIPRAVRGLTGHNIEDSVERHSSSKPPVTFNVFLDGRLRSLQEIRLAYSRRVVRTTTVEIKLLNSYIYI
jgi:hypothetical protein